MSEYVLARSETTQEGGRGQLSEVRHSGQVVSTKINGPQITTSEDVPGKQTVTRTQDEVTITSSETTPATTITTIQTRPANTTTQKAYGHIGVQFSLTLKVTSIHPVDPAGGSGLVCS